MFYFSETMVYCESTFEVTEILGLFQSQMSDLSLYYPLSETYQRTITFESQVYEYFPKRNFHCSNVIFEFCVLCKKIWIWSFDLWQNLVWNINCTWNFSNRSNQLEILFEGQTSNLAIEFREIVRRKTEFWIKKEEVRSK